MNVFITGATGKVGSRFVPRLLERGHRATVLVRDAAKAEALLRIGAEVVEGDLLEPASYSDAMRGCDTIVHLAAQFRGVDAETARRSNVEASIVLAETALEAQVPRFVLASTSLVYGSGGYERPSREDDALHPASPYPQTKAAAEEALRRLHIERGLGLRIVRFAFVYGDRDPHVAEFLPIMASWHPAKRLHMLHHADASQVLLLATSTPGIDGRTYNAADDAPLTAAELFQLHGREQAHQGDAPQQELRPWDMLIDTARIRDELNYRPIFPSFYTARDAGAL